VGDDGLEPPTFSV